MKIEKHYFKYFGLKPRLVCVMAVKNEERNLPGFFSHLRDYVDGFIILDDGSTDSSINIIKQEKKLIKLIKNPQHCIEDWDDRKNRLQLMSAAIEYADVVLCCDADERFELKFLKKLRSYAREIWGNKNKVLGLKFRELWDSKTSYRSDGIWNTKTKYILFYVFPNMRFKNTYRQRLHIQWYHDEIKKLSLLDYNLYHLKMISLSSRKRRAEVYESLDPNHKFQSIGYKYLVETNGLQLTNIDGHEYDLLSTPKIEDL